MIDRIEGRVVELEPTHVVLDVGGVGFFLSITLQSYEQIGRGERVRLFTHLQVREDLLQLFGFVHREERWTFQQLIAVNGVGPRVAQAILSSLPVEALGEAVSSSDWKRLTAAPGVGKKLAERMVIELRDKFKPIGGDEDLPLSGGAVPAGVAPPTREAVQALMSLGHTQQSAEKLVARVMKGAEADLSVEELIRDALRL